MESKPVVAAVVVTYNRSALLLNCLKSIVEQSLAPDVVYIVNNRSTDDTQQVLRDNGYITEASGERTEFGELFRAKVGGIEICYLLKDENDGGAGGFHAGQRMAWEGGADWVWMMDDDGVADKDELAELLDKCTKHGIAVGNPLVVNIDDHSRLAFGLAKGATIESLSDREVLLHALSPFNGTFIRRDVIDKIGFVKREMFIWGDEHEYLQRCRKNRYLAGTVCTALHYHPENRVTMASMIPLIPLLKLPYLAAERSWIHYRNRGYIHKHYASKVYPIVWLSGYTIMFLTRFQFGKLRQCYKYYFKGHRGDFSK